MDPAVQKRLRQANLPTDEDAAEEWPVDTMILKMSLMTGILTGRLSIGDLIAVERVSRQWRAYLSDTSTQGVWFYLFSALADKYRLFVDPSTGAPVYPISSTVNRPFPRGLGPSDKNWRHVTIALLAAVDKRWDVALYTTGSGHEYPVGEKKQPEYIALQGNLGMLYLLVSPWAVNDSVAKVTVYPDVESDNPSDAVRALGSYFLDQPGIYTRSLGRAVFEVVGKEADSLDESVIAGRRRVPMLLLGVYVLSTLMTKGGMFVEATLAASPDQSNMDEISDEEGPKSYPAYVRSAMPAQVGGLLSFFTGRSMISRLPMSQLKETYDTWATSYDGQVLGWLRQYVRARQPGDPRAVLQRYMKAKGYTPDESTWDPEVANTILADFGVDLSPSGWRKSVTLSDADAMYLMRTLSQLEATREVEKTLLDTALASGAATETEVKTIALAETARDHVQHMGTETLKAIEERDALRAQNQELRQALDKCRADANRAQSQVEAYAQRLVDYERRLEQAIARAVRAPVDVPSPPAPPPPPPLPSTPPPPIPVPPGAPTKESTQASVNATTATLTSALPGDLQSAIAGFNAASLRKAKKNDKPATSETPANPLMDALRSRLASRRKGITGMSAEIAGILKQLETGKLKVNNDFKLIATNPCTVCERVSIGGCGCKEARYCGQECVEAHWEEGDHKSVCKGK